MGFLQKVRNIFIKEEQDIKFKAGFEDDFIVINPNMELFKNDKIIDLINMYSIEERNNQLYIDYDAIYDLYYDEYNNEIDTYKYFDLPCLFRGFTRIENINNFIQDKKVLFSFEMEGYEGKYESLKGNIVHCLINEDVKILPPKVYELFKIIIDYNKDQNKNQEVALQFDTLRTIKEYADEINIVLNQRLRDEEKPIVIDKIKLDLQDDGDVLNIVPNLYEDKDINKELVNKLYQYSDIKDFYSTDVNGKKVKFVIKNKETLNKVVKQKEVKGEERLKVLSGDSQLFQDDNIDLSEFGPRVIGIGYLSYRSFPATNKNSDLMWRESNTEPPHFYAGSDKVVLYPNQLKELEEKLVDMNKNEEKVTELSFNTENGSQAKIIVNQEQLKNEILKLQNSIISPTEIKSKEVLNQIIEKYDQVSNDDNYIPIKGKYVEKYDKQFFVDRVEEINNKEKKKSKKDETLIVFENIDKEEYREDDAANECQLKEAQIPKLLRENIALFDYQKEALLKLQNLYLLSSINGFLLCDDMGLGKTLQLLSFLAWIKEKGELQPSLIVAPTSLLNNWDNDDGNGEIQKFFRQDTFKTKKVVGRIQEEELSDIRESDIVFTTYESLRLNNILLGKIQWSIMICDEAQKIKNPQTLVTVAAKAQNSKFKIVCSATPIENSLIDLWNLVDYSKPGVLGSLKEFKSNYINKIKNQSEENLELINTELQNKINNYYIRREKDVLPKSLPTKKIKIYKIKAKQHEVECIDRLIHSESNTLSLIQKMLVASSHIDLLSDNNLEDESIEDIVSRSSKLQTLRGILENIKQSDEKVLIFTRSIKIQQLIYRCIDNWFNIKVNIVNGTAGLDKRTKYLDKFRYKSGFNAIILSPEVAGFGLTLTEANHVIHFTRLWNPAKEDQSTDRVYRIGQVKDVTVHYPMLSFGEDIVEEFLNAEEYINQYKEIKKGLLSPEEKLNILLARKKNMLMKFFLAVPDTDINQKEFLDFGNDSIEGNKNGVTMNDLENGIIDAFEFEALVAIIFEKNDYTTFLTSRSNDNGVDVVCIKDNEVLLIQCKKVRKLNGIDTIKDLLYAKSNYETHIPNLKYNLAIATNTDQIPQRIQENEGIIVFDENFFSNELRNNKIYKVEIDIKNNDRYSFERLKLKLNSLKGLKSTSN